MAESVVRREVSVPTTSFFSTRVNSSTFLVIEDDSFGEHPHIYIKCYPEHILLTDTGCNSPRQKGLSITVLKEYLETVPIACYNNEPLNLEGRKPYIIICSHCHFDHILGISQFLDNEPVIVSSSFDKSFLLEDFSEHSLCKIVGVPTPMYEISHWAKHLEYFSPAGKPLRIQFLHVPGHTPDSLAWYDLDEHHLYVGDTFYEQTRQKSIPGIPVFSSEVYGLPATQAAIVFPDSGGNWIQYMSSLELLLSFVVFKNSELKSLDDIKRVKVGCGHITYDADAETMIAEVQALFKRIIFDEVPVTRSETRQGVLFDYWLENEDSRYSVFAPRRLASDAKKHFRPDQ